MSFFNPEGEDKREQSEVEELAQRLYEKLKGDADYTNPCTRSVDGLLCTAHDCPWPKGFPGRMCPVVGVLAACADFANDRNFKTAGLLLAALTAWYTSYAFEEGDR